MDLLRILHCADFHIGMRFSDYSQRDALREARKTAVSRVVAAARAADCHLLTVSGDLFDRVSMNKADVSSVAASLSQFPGRAVLVLPGNHDYAGAESTLWRDFRDAASDHVHVLDEREPFHLADYEIPAVVYPAPCDAKHSAEHRVGYIADTIAAERHGHPGGHDSAEAIPEARPWRIGMAHGSIEGVSPDFDGRYFPMRREELREAGVDVWLLGHSHVSWPESLSDSPRILNPGTPEPDGFDCTHPGHAFIVELGTSEPMATVSVRRITTGSFRFRHEKRTLTGSDDVDSLEHIVDSGTAPTTILRLELDGRLDSESMRRLEGAVSALRDRVAELDVRHENLHAAITRERITDTYPAGSFASTLLLSFADEDDQDALEMAWDIIEESRQ